MTRIDSVSRYLELTNAAQSEKGSVNINCYLMSDELQRVIAEGKLHYARNNSGIAIFLDCGLYYRLYLHINPDVAFTVEGLDRPVITEFLGSGKLPGRSARTAELLLASGFSEGVATARMTMNLDAGDAHRFAPPADSLFSVITAQARHADGIMEAWNSAFDSVHHLIPTRQELDELITRNNMLVAVDSAGKVVGAVQSSYDKSHGWMWHEAVLPQYRGNKIGEMLTAAHLADVLSRGIGRFTIWVEAANEGAIRFHLRVGYVFDGKICKQYILK